MKKWMRIWIVILLGCGVVYAQTPDLTKYTLEGLSLTVVVTDDVDENAENLVAAYEYAATYMGPAASKRIIVIVPPARYNLNYTGNPNPGSLVMDTSFIDLIGQTSDRDAQYLYGTPAGDMGVIQQSVDNVLIENLTADNKNTIEIYPGGGSDNSYAYSPGSGMNGAQTVIRNCAFISTNPIYPGWTMRHVVEYAGYYENCSAGDAAFACGGSGAIASGIFINCNAGGTSFGSNGGVASGTFINCTADNNSYGGAGGTLSTAAILVNCTAGNGSFGTYSTAAKGFNYNATSHLFDGGPIISRGGFYGDGSGLSNLDASTAIEDGTITANKIAPDLQEEIDKSASKYYYQQSITDGAVSYDPIMSKENMVQWAGTISGTEWKDISGSLPAKLVDSHSLAFNGYSTSINVGNPPELQITGSQTISFWIAPNDIASARRNPVYKCYGGEGGITINTSGIVCYYYGTSGVESLPYHPLRTDSVLPLHEWTHLTVVRDLDNMKLYWYINGQQDAEDIAPYPSAAVSSYDFKIGSGYMDECWGRMADVRVWNTALNADQVQQVVSGHYDVAVEYLAGAWPLAEGDGNTVHDVSGNDNHSAIDGGYASWSASSQEVFHYNITKGFSQKCIQFNGNASSVLDINNADYSLNNDFSIGLWVYSDDTDGLDSIFGWYTDNHTAGAAIFVQNGEVRFRLSDGIYNDSDPSEDEPYRDIGYPFSLKQWTHIIVTKTSSTMKLFVNGVPRDERSDFIGDMNINRLLQDQVLGAVGSVGSGFFGKMHDFVFCSSALSDVEAAELYAGQLPGAAAYHFSFADGSLVDTIGGATLVNIETAFPRIPALADLSGFDATGSLISNPAGNWHNGAETKIRQDINNTALKEADDNFWYNSDGSEAVARGYEDLLDMADSDRIIIDTSVPGRIKSIRTFDEALTGDDLTNAKSFTDENKVELNDLIAANSTLDMRGNKIVNLGEAEEDADAASQGHVKTLMQQVPGYGDIPMGEFTSQVSMPGRPAGPGLTVDTSEIADEAIDTDQLATDAVTEAKIENNAVTTDKIAPAAVTADKLAPNIVLAVPTGAIMAWPSQANPPAGWVECDGRALDKGDYQVLFSIIGTTYGEVGNTFNIPDYRGYFLRGRDGGKGRDPDAGGRSAPSGQNATGDGGDTVGSTQDGEIESHSHQILQSLNWGGQSDYHGMPNNYDYSSKWGEITTYPEGGAETRPINIYVMWIIKL